MLGIKLLSLSPLLTAETQLCRGLNAVPVAGRYTLIHSLILTLNRLYSEARCSTGVAAIMLRTLIWSDYPLSIFQPNYLRLKIQRIIDFNSMRKTISNL
jgi:hypothetical protein